MRKQQKTAPIISSEAIYRDVRPRKNFLKDKIMDVAQMETFLAVAEEKSFSRAAVRMHRTQPAISQVIRKLEEELGEVLLDRSARDGSLTAAGELLKAYAQRMIALR